MNTNSANLIHIFRAGRRQAMDGRVLEFSDADLAASAAAYDPAMHEAPLVIGHPATDAPAHGWVSKLVADGADLNAVPQQVNPAFAESVQRGEYKKISASFYLPDSPANPVPGVYYLRHVGFLGAQQPAVKGLRQVSFAGSDSDACTIEFADYDDVLVARLFRSMREWIIGKFGKDEADAVLSGDDISALETMAAQPESDDGSLTSSYAESEDTMTEKKQQDAAFAERERELKEREQRIAQAEKEAHRKDVANFVEGLVKDGKVLPRDQAGLVAYLAGPDDKGAIEFGEGDQKKSQPADAWLRSFLAGLPKQIDFTEHSKQQEEGKVVNFAAPNGFAVDSAQLELHRKALAYQAQHPNTDYVTAVTAVSK